MPNQEHERERDQTHSYWYIPSAPRVNYSLLVMESAGMMKMATGDGSPLRYGAGTGSRLVFHGYRGLRRRNSRSRFLSGSLGLYKRCWSWEQVRGSPRRPRGRPTRLGGWGRPPPSWVPRDSPGPTLLLRGLLLVHKKSSKIGTAIGLRLIFLFFKTQKQGKNRNWHWALG